MESKPQPNTLVVPGSNLKPVEGVNEYVLLGAMVFEVEDETVKLGENLDRGGTRKRRPEWDFYYIAWESAVVAPGQVRCA